MVFFIGGFKPAFYYPLEIIASLAVKINKKLHYYKSSSPGSKKYKNLTKIGGLINLGKGW
ncbi:hypothetical protein A9Q73_05450 [Bermanella sp. 47_1433_sub80_T6]|nr:hypothetical protein A9Q73_05450 [Bermanella sp. 47_1433_sub80_T6]